MVRARAEELLRGQPRSTSERELPRRHASVRCALEEQQSSQSGQADAEAVEPRIRPAWKSATAAGHPSDPRSHFAIRQVGWAKDMGIPWCPQTHRRRSRGLAHEPSTRAPPGSGAGPGARAADAARGLSYAPSFARRSWEDSGRGQGIVPH